MWTALKQFSFRHAQRAPLRSALVALGIALGVALYVSTRATGDSLVVTFETMVEQVSGKADLTLVGYGAGVSDALTAELGELEGIAHASSIIEITLRDPERDAPLLILGVDFLGDPYFLPFDVQDGDADVVEDPLAFVNDPHAILISRTLADRRGLDVGGTLDLMSANGQQTFHVRGILEDTGPAAAFDGQVAVMFLDAAQVSFARGHQVDRIEIALDPNADREAVLARIAERVRGRAEVELPNARRRKVLALLDPIRAVLSLSGLLALIVAMFLIYNAVGISVAQRRPEIGLLRALGASRGMVVWLFCNEAVALAIPAGLLGVWLGGPLADLAIAQTVPAISQLYLPLRPPPAQVDGRLALEAMGVGLLTTLLAALWPAMRAARVDPAESLRGRSLVAKAGNLPHRRLLLAGCALSAGLWLVAQANSLGSGIFAAVATLAAGGLIAPALLVALRSVLGRGARGAPSLHLGLSNVHRELERSTINVIALMAAVATSVTIGAWVGSMQRSVESWFGAALTGELVVSAGSPLNDQFNIPFSEDVLEKLDGIEAIEASMPYRFLQQKVNGMTLTLAGYDMDTYLQQLERRGIDLKIIEGATPIAPHELAARPAVILTVAAARRLALGAGDQLTLQTPQGPAQLEVRAIIADYFLDRPAALLDRKQLGQLFADRSIDSIDLFLTAGTDPDAVAELVRKRLGGGDLLFVTRFKLIEERILNTVEESFAYARSIELIALIVALMGVMGTMLAAVIDRTRELGVLRAIGATPAQVAAAITAEAAALGLAAALLGILVGTLQGALVVGHVVGPLIEWDLSFVFPGATALRIGFLVVMTATFTGFIPGRKAARLDLKQALGYE